MKKKEFDNWSFAKEQSVLYKECFYPLIGVNFELNRICIKINGQYKWIGYKQIQLIPF